MGNRRHLWPGDELGRGPGGRVHAKQEVVPAVGGPIVKYWREGRGRGGEATWWAGRRGRCLFGKAGEGEEEAAGWYHYARSGRGTSDIPLEGGGPLPAAGPLLRRGAAFPLPPPGGTSGPGGGGTSSLASEAGPAVPFVARCGWGRAEGRGEGRYQEGGAGKGEAPADNGAYVCLREWDGAAAAAAAAGGRRCAAAAAGPGPGPPGLRAAPDRSPLPYSAPPLPSPTPASGVSGTSGGGGGEGPKPGVGGPGPRPRVLSGFEGRGSESHEGLGGWGEGREAVGVEVVDLELSLEKPVGGDGGASSAHRSLSGGERRRHLSVYFLEVVSQAVLGETKRGDGTVPGSWDEGAFEGRDGELNEGIRVESGGVC